MSRAVNTLMSVERFLQQVQQKEAGTYEPGSIGGSTSHQSKNVDSHTYPPREGEHSEENNKDVKDQLKNDTAIIGEGKKKEAIDSIPTPGLNEAPSGEDPENEKPKKMTKDDNAGQRLGRTTHVARADNPGLDKIAYDELSIEEHYKVATDLGNQFLALLSISANEQPEQPAQQSAKQASADEVDEAAQLGWELAGVVDARFDKKAATQFVNDAVYNLIKAGNDDGDNIVEYLSSFYAAREETAVKSAQTQAKPQRKQAMAMPPGAGGPPPAEGGAPAGADPAAGGGDPAAGGEGGGGEEELLAMLEQIAQQQGISVEDLIAQLMESGAGGEGGGEGAPAPGAEPGMEVAASEKSASVRQKAAAPKKASTAETTRAYVQELLNRSKA